VVAVEPDRRIVFTWGYEGEDQAVPAGSSTVEITLEPQPDGTRVRLRHTGLPAGEPPPAHLAGWRHALAALAYAGSADQLAPLLGARVGDWLAAWNEPDPARRAALLGRCLADGSQFRDPTAAVDGAGPLADTSAWSSGWPAGRGWWAGERPSRATAWSPSAGRPSARARSSWPPAPTWPGSTWTAGSAG
jgi:Activator of Hsp90 ATPase homolog 1-like protein